LEHRQALVEKLAQAEAIGVALKRVQNALASSMAHAQEATCEVTPLLSWVARSRPLGAAYRDAVQSVRVEAGRVRTLLAAPTVSPLVDENDRRDAESLLNKSVAEARQYLEVLAWQRRFVDPLWERCKPELSPAEGISAGVLAQYTPLEKPIAVIAVGG